MRRDHSWSSLMTMSSANGNDSHTRRGTAEFTFEKSVTSKLSSSVGLEALHSRLGAVEEVEEVALGRAWRLVRQLPAVDARDRVVPERRGEMREPRVVGRVRVLAREDERLAARELRTEVARAAVVELARRDGVDARAEALARARRFRR